MLQSKQRLLELNAKLAETLTNKGVTASSDETTTALIDKVKNISGSDKLIEFSQMNDTVKSFINNVTYTDDYCITQVTNYNASSYYRKDQPIGCDITLKNAGQLKIYDKNKVLTSDSIAGSHTIYNLTPNVISHYINLIDGNIAQCGTIKPSGQVRMIKADSVNNVRDLGGWRCDGGFVKYGLLFRGGELNGEHSIIISNDDKAVFRDLLGIRAELDLRGSYELDMDTDDTSDDIVSSALGDDVQYNRISVYQYKDGIDFDNSNKLYLRLAEAVRVIFDNAKSGIPTYFHCVSGADRTGTLAALIEAVLGVTQSDIDKDYELTYFTNEGSSAQRIRTDNLWVNFISYLKSMDGDTLAGKTASWLILAGFTLDEINEFRRNMIDGSPDVLINQIDYTCKGISINQSILSLNANDTATLTVSLTPSWATGSVSWTTSDNYVTSISANGNSATVTALSAGTATVTATCNGYSVICEVTATAKELVYDTVLNGITEGIKISSSDYKTETTGQVNYGASEYISASGYTHYKMSNDYDGLHPANIANEYLIFYDADKNYIAKSDAIQNKAYAAADILTGELPINTAYIRLRAYCSSTVEEQRAGYFGASVVQLGRF